MKTKSKPKLQDVLKSECEILFKQVKQNFWYFLIAVFFVWGCTIIFKPIFHKVDFLNVISSEIWDRFVLGLSLLVIARHFVWALNDYILSRLYEFVVLVVLFVYLNYRIIDTDYWIFSTFTWNKSVFYLDIILGSLFLGIVMVRAKRLRNSIKRSTGNPLNNSLITHTSAESDGYKRSPSAKEFMDIILQSEDENAIAVGIVGPWGAGKSWYMAKMEDRVTEKYSDTHVVIKMNPWKSSTGQDIIVQFLNTLKDNLAVNNGNFNRLIDSYIKSITQIDKTNSLSTFISNWGKSETEDDEHKMIQNELAKNNKRFVIFIDDIDRLGDSEVMEVLKLIRNTANFKGLYYVVGYDKSQLLMAISKKFKHKHEKFLDKIFQIEKELSIIPSYLLKNEFIDELDKFKGSNVVTKDDSIEINNQVLNIINGLKGIGPTSYLSTIFDLTVKNKRELLKLMNSFKLKVVYLKNERIDLVQLLVLEILNLIDYKNYRSLQDLSDNSIQISGNSYIYLNNTVNIPFVDTRPDDIEYEMWILLKGNLDIGSKLMSILFHKSEDPDKYGKIYNLQYFNSFFEFSGALTSSIFIKEFLENENVDINSKIKQYTEGGQLNELIKIVKDEGLRIMPNDSDKYERFIGMIDSLSIISKEGLLNQGYFNSSKLDELYEGEANKRWDFIKKTSNSVSAFNKYLLWEVEVRELHYCENIILEIEDFISKLQNDKHQRLQNGDKWRKTLLNQIVANKLETKMIQSVYEFDEKNNAYSIKSYYKFLFVNYENLAEFVDKLKESFWKHEFLTFYRRFKFATYNSISFERGTIEFVSDSNNNFDRSTLFYPDGPSEPVKNFIHHDWHSSLLNLDDRFNGIDWMAKDVRINNVDELRRGDCYYFSREIDLTLYNSFTIKSATLSFMVDDMVSIDMNESRICEATITENKRVHNIDLNLKDVRSSIQLSFELTNTSMPTAVSPIDNPCGLVYILEIRYDYENLK